MPFRAELDYTLKDVRQYWKVHQLFRGKALYYISWLLIAVVICLVISAGAMLLVYRLWNGELVWYYVIILIVLVLYYAVREFRVRSTLKSLRAQGMITMTAGEDGMHAEAEALSSDYSYRAFQDVARFKETYYLYVDRRRALILPDRCFTEGDPADFGVFLEQKTGIMIRDISW